MCALNIKHILLFYLFYGQGELGQNGYLYNANMEYFYFLHTHNVDIPTKLFSIHDTKIPPPHTHAHTYTHLQGTAVLSRDDTSTFLFKRILLIVTINCVYYDKQQA